jgi:hypothetical protein
MVVRMHRSVVHWCSAGYAALVLFSASAAHAQQAGADVLFDAGRKLMDARQYEEAIAKLRDSYRVDPAAGTLLNLAECYVKTHRTASAWSTYREAAAIAASGGEKDRERFAVDHAAALEPVLSTLSVVVPAETRVAGLSVMVNGGIVPEALWGQPFPVDPGHVAIAASAPGRVTWTRTVELGERADAVVIAVPLLQEIVAAAPPVTPTAPSAAPSAAPVPAPSEETTSDAGSTQQVLAYVLGGAGIVGLGVGVGLYARAESTIHGSNCPDDRCVVGVGNYVQHENGRAQERVAVGVGVAGLALGATGVVLLLASPSHHDSASGVRMSVTAGSNGCGLLLGGAL